MALYQFTTTGVCSQEIQFEIDENGKIHQVKFFGGCSGNLQAIGKLVEGKDALEIANLLEGNDCGGRGTSCADQLSQALKQALAHSQR